MVFYFVSGSSVDINPQICDFNPFWDRHAIVIMDFLITRLSILIPYLLDMVSLFGDVYGMICCFALKLCSGNLIPIFSWHFQSVQ